MDFDNPAPNPNAGTRAKRSEVSKSAAVCHDPHFADAAVKFGVLPPHYADLAELSSDEPQAPCAAASSGTAGAIHITTAVDLKYLNTGNGLVLATWAVNLAASNAGAVVVLHVFTDGRA